MRSATLCCAVLCCDPPVFPLPTCAAEAVAVLKEYYLQLRAASLADPGGLPITARQLESLVCRLAEPSCVWIGRLGALPP
mgnify:CR=1 FL=1